MKKLVIFEILLVIVGVKFLLLDNICQAQTIESIKWSEATPPNYNHGQPGLASVDGKIYLIGGGDPITGSFDYRKVEMYDPQTDTWTDRADMPRGKAGNFGAVAANGKIYALGGEGPYAGRWSPEIYEYNPVTDTWKQKGNWANPRRDFGYTELNGKIYIAGGMPDYYNYSNRFELYDPLTDTWSNLANLPSTMTTCPLATVNGKIYMIGGRSGSESNFQITDWIYMYDPVSNSWTQKTSMIGPRFFPSLAVYDNKIYLIGGSDKIWGNYISTVWEYDPATDQWSTLSTINFRETWGHHFWSPVVDNKTYFFGSSDYKKSGVIKIWQCGEFLGSSGGLNLTFNQIDASGFPIIHNYVTVTDDQGNPIPSLTESNFTVSEDGHAESPLTVTSLGGSSVPISAALVIDRSGSMSGQKLQDAKDAAIMFVNQMATNDKATVISFSSSVKVDQGFTSDKNRLMNAINSLAAGGGTAIYDACIEAVNQTNNQSGRKAIILMTDGVDNSSSNSLQDAITTATQSNVPVYTIGLGISQGSTQEQNLQQLANDTGGKYYYAPSSSDLQQIYQLISQQLQNQYKITYTTHNSNRDGSTRTVEITAADQGNTDTKSRTYIAPSGGGIPIFPETPNPQLAGNEFWVDIKVGNSANPVSNLFGVSFVLNYTNTNYVDVVVPYSTSVIPGSLLGSDLVFYSSVDDAAGKLSIGISRKSGQGGINGSGSIVRVKFVAQTNTPDGTQIQFSLTEVTANDPAGAPITLSPQSIAITINSGVSVWSGDTNNDGKVNQADVLPVGLYWGKTGPKRNCHSSSQEMQWIKHYSTPWNPLSATYADANGDGVVNQAEILAVGLNWGKTHSLLAKFSKLLEGVGAIQTPTLSPKATPSQVQVNEEFNVSIVSTEVNDLFGVSFELKYDPKMMEILSVAPDAQFGSDVVFYSNVNDSAGIVSVGISRKAGQGGVNGTIQIVNINSKSKNITQDETIDLTLQNVNANDSNGAPIELSLISSDVKIITGVSESIGNQIPSSFSLYQNHPNPFNPETTIRYDIAKSTHVLLKVYNYLGQEVAILYDGNQQPGVYQIRWDGYDTQGQPATSGIYILQIRAGNFVSSRKMLLVR